METPDDIRVLTADFGFQRYVVILASGYKQVCEYFSEIFIFREIIYEGGDIDMALEGATHADKCDILTRHA